MQNFLDQFYLNFIKDDRWKYLTDGLKTTLLITFFAVILGLVLGFLVAIVRSSAVKSGIKKPAKIKEKGVYFRKLLGYYLFKLVDFICQLYLTVILRYTYDDSAADYVLCNFRKRYHRQKGGGDSGLRHQLRRICGGNRAFRHYGH